MRKKIIVFVISLLSGMSLFFSCASSQAVPVARRGASEPKKPSLIVNSIPEHAPRRESSAPVAERRAQGQASVSSPERTVPSTAERTINPSIDWPLLGRGQMDAEKLAAFLLKVNSKADPEFVKELSLLYIEEAALEGVDHDVAFAQMCLETGFLRYGGLVTSDMNNFCGLGALGPEKPGERFPTPQMGVRAQMQHLKGYATTDPLSQELVDPRYKFVRYGSAPTIEGLAGTWAADRGYAEKIVAILQRLYAASNVAAGQASSAGEPVQGLPIPPRDKEDGS
ncbi:MAG: glucosaminidase domain-containing protein [Treponema sp.]|nr:glucosaminidase domain-containing protein [Treponema sp.]